MALALCSPYIYVAIYDSGSTVTSSSSSPHPSSAKVNSPVQEPNPQLWLGVRYGFSKMGDSNWWPEESHVVRRLVEMANSQLSSSGKSQFAHSIGTDTTSKHQNLTTKNADVGIVLESVTNQMNDDVIIRQERGRLAASPGLSLEKAPAPLDEPQKELMIIPEAKADAPKKKDVPMPVIAGIVGAIIGSFALFLWGCCRKACFSDTLPTTAIKSGNVEKRLDVANLQVPAWALQSLKPGATPVLIRPTLKVPSSTIASAIERVKAESQNPHFHCRSPRVLTRTPSAEM